MTSNDVLRIIKEYDALIDRAIAATAPGGGYYAAVDHDDRPRLSIKGEDAVLSWREYESDYYGGGYTSDESATFPAALLTLSDDEFNKFMTTSKREIAEREMKVRAAQAAVERERREAFERAEYARLCAKFAPR